MSSPVLCTCTVLLAGTVIRHCRTAAPVLWIPQIAVAAARYADVDGDEYEVWFCAKSRLILISAKFINYDILCVCFYL